MTISQIISISVVATGLLIGALALGFSSGSGRGSLRWFSLVAFSAALYALSNIVHDSVADSALVRMVGRASMSAVHLHAVAWTMYFISEQRRRPSRVELGVVATMLALALLALVPRLLVTDDVRHRSVAWLGVDYLDQVAALPGLIGYLLSIGTIVYIAARFSRAWRRGVPGALAKFGGLLALLAAALNDLLASEGVINTPYLLELAFLAEVVEVGFALTTQFVTAARAQETLAVELEVTLANRTKQLVQVHEALVQSEKLAAVGRLAGGVAHEINNPAAAVSANIEYLQHHFRSAATLPEDGAQVLDECIESLRRITQVVRELLDAGRVAGNPSNTEAVSILKMVEAAVIQARRSVPLEVEVELDVPEDLTAMSAQAALEQAVANLLVNAGQAVAGRPAGRIVVSAVRSNARVHVTVSDNGPGIAASAIPHVFEPFFTTRAPGQGTGLGLSVSLGLLRALGGDLRVAASSAAGTQMEIDLPTHLSPYPAPFGQ